jgi:hypothetical protein
MFKIVKGLVIIFLILCTMPLNLYAESNSDSLSMNKIFLNSLDIKVNSADNFTINSNNSSNIVLDHILDVNPDLTTGELNAIYTMMSEQFDSEFGSRKMNFYTMYLNNSTEYPVDGLPYTARELYESKDSTYYKSWVDSVEQIINDYGHMSQQKRVDFLITKNPSMKNIMDVFDNADNTEKLYLAQSLENFTIPKYPTLATGDPAIDIGSINKYKDNIKTAVYNLGTEILRTDKSYKLKYQDILPNINDGADFNESFDNDVNKLFYYYFYL